MKGLQELNKINILYDADDPPAGGDPISDDPPKDPPKSDDPEPKTIPYDRFKTVNDEKKKLEDQLAEILKKQKEASEKDLKDQEKWKDLYEQTKKEAESNALEALRLKVAAKKKLPVDLIDRLRGDTEEEIGKDADMLLEFIQPDDSPGNPRHSKKGGGTGLKDIKDMTPEEIRNNTAAILAQSQK